jgi:hypothetical protein
MIKTMVTVAVSFAALVTLLLPHAPMKRISDLRPTSQDSTVILNDSLRRQLSAILTNHDVPGYALSIAHAGAEAPIEYANWGIATEDGAPMTSDVRMGIVMIGCLLTLVLGRSH